MPSRAGTRAATTTAAVSIEKDLRRALAERLGPDKFGLWFGEGVRLGVDGDNLVVGVPNGFFREWIQGHYAESLTETAQGIAGRSLRLDFQIDAEAEPPLGNVVAPPIPGSGRPHGPTVPIPTAPPRPVEKPSNRLNDHVLKQTGQGAARAWKRLDDFVTGPSNRLAHAAAVEMAQSAGGSFNPLVVHGGVGLGKTHLLEGIAHGLKQGHAGRNVLHVTAEAFTNHFLEAMRTGSLSTFRNRYRRGDALIIDDVHFLAAKRASLQEFLHTFNTIHATGAPIVIAADQHPRLIARLTDELATRFVAGMVVKVEAPDPATRRAILSAKALARGVELPEAVLAYIAEHLRGSVRELEGALHSLIAHAMLVGKRIDLNLARTALRDTIRHTATALALKDVEQAVCLTFSMTPDALRSDNRARSVSHPRMLAMFLARKHTPASYSEIGRYFGGRNHSTVISAEKKVLAWLKEEQRCGLLAGFEAIADVVSAIEQTLGA